MGHRIDKLGYNQIYQDEPFIRKEWSKLKAFIEGGPGISSEQLEKLVTPEIVEKWVSAYMAKHGFAPKQ
jgi:hypothetical protein